MNGYFVLGGGSGVLELPGFSRHYTGNLVGSRDKGQWVLDTGITPTIINIPARDKHVQVWCDHPPFEEALSLLDSNGTGPYASKLAAIPIPTGSVAVAVNVNVSTHGSLGMRFETPLYVYGLSDTQMKTSYLVWSTDESHINTILNTMPLRFLLYRFPVAESGSIFIQGEAVCSKWWRWLKNHTQLLHAFNALEQRMYG